MEFDLSKYISKKTKTVLYDENNNFEDFKCNPLIKTKTIKEYFDNSHIFITGSTGFLGKVLIEKLLRTCDGISKIYILMRTKRGLTTALRFEEFKKHKVFEKVREKFPEILEKLVCITGDINEHQIGLSESDTELLCDRVDIVFHVAATVKFNEPLKNSVKLNTFGTQRVMDFCLKMTNLKSLVHVSTAYSNPYLHNVGEQVYGSTLSDDHRVFMSALNEENDTQIKNRFGNLHPNTYTLTKHMAEHIVNDYHGRLPLCIVRPSIVTVSHQEPFPGWIDNIYGIAGVLMEIGRGTISSVVGVGDYKVDLIPVDTVCNRLIVAAWSNSFVRQKTIPVYNCVSGHSNPQSWDHMVDSYVKYAKKYPSKYTMLYPSSGFRTSYLVQGFFRYFYHYLPAIFFDIVLRFQGKKAFMFKLARRFQKAIEAGTYFALHEWNFDSNSLERVLKAANDTQIDAFEFNCDSSNIDWESYMEKFVLGIRTFVLKDDLSSLPAARRKLKKLTLLRRIFYGTLILLAFFWCYKVLTNIVGI